MADATELQKRLDNQRWLLAEYRRDEKRARANINRVMEKIHALKREAYQAGVSLDQPRAATIVDGRRTPADAGYTKPPTMTVGWNEIRIEAIITNGSHDVKVSCLADHFRAEAPGMLPVEYHGDYSMREIAAAYIDGREPQKRIRFDDAFFDSFEA